MRRAAVPVLLLAVLLSGCAQPASTTMAMRPFSVVETGIPELQNPGRTSWAWNDVRECLKLKLWEPEQERLVGWDGEPARAA